MCRRLPIPEASSLIFVRGVPCVVEGWISNALLRDAWQAAHAEPCDPHAITRTHRRPEALPCR